MRLFPLLLVSSLAASYASSVGMAADLTPDPAVTWGKLDSGLRYALMHNEQPKDKVTLRLQVRCGSLNEQDQQRGLAHYLEHLAFNGTTHYPPGTLVERLQHLGLQFGAHTNAHTSFDETVYKLDLPDAKPETIATGLGVMADWGGGMLLATKEVDKERGVILAELRDRDGADLRQTRALLATQYAGTFLADRLPIGHAETIQAADRQLIATYYAAWYRPERMILTVVGAIDPQAVEAQVRSAMSEVHGQGDPVADPAQGALQPEQHVVALHIADKEAKDTSIMLARAMVEAQPEDSVAHRRDELVRALAESVFARRLNRLIEQDPNCPLQAAGAYSYHWLGFANAGVEGTAKPGSALAALQLAAREYRRLLEYGPTASELALEVTAYKTRLETAVSQAGTRSNQQLAEMAYRTASHREVMLSPVQERDLELPMLPTITPVEIVERIKAYRARPGRDIAAITGREDLGAGAEARIVAACEQVAGEQLARQAERELAPWGYPASAAVAGDAAGWVTGPVNDQGVVGKQREGVRIQNRAATAQPNQVLISVRFETGVIPRAAGIGELIERGFLAGGLGKHSADDETSLFADSSVKLGGISVGEDAVTLSATCTPGDYQRALERLAAHISDPGWRSEAEQRVKQSWDEELAGAELDIEAQTERTVQAALVGNDPARRAATRAEAAAVTFAQAKAWLAPILAKAPLTITTVGDIAQAKGDPQVVFQLAGRSPFPAAADPAGIRQRLAISPPRPTGERRVTVHAQVPKSLVRIAWPGDDIYDIGQTRRLNLLAQCLSERLRIKIREELGAAYSPYAYYGPSEAYRGAGSLNAVLGVSPDQADRVAKAALDLADALVASGIDDTLLDQVKTPLVKGLAARKQRNDWWLGTVLPRLATQPFRLEWAKGLEADIQSINAAELSVLAKRFLVRDQALVVIGTAAP